MNKHIFNSANLSLKVNQIVCLEHKDNYLYGEVIQLIPRRNICWFRPMCLIITDYEEIDPSFRSKQHEKLGNSKRNQPINCEQDNSKISLEYWQIKSQQLNYYSFAKDDVVDGLNSAAFQLIDLQSTSDLFWPAILFRPALDTEVITYFTQLEDIRRRSNGISSNYQYLNKFIHQYWKANQDKF